MVALGSVQDAIVHLAIGLIATARSGFESAPIEYGDMAAVVVDELVFLQLICGLGYAPATHAQHEGEEFMRDTEGVRVHPVLRHQKPSGKARLDHMVAGAGRRLRELAEQDEDVAIKPALQRRAAAQLAPKLDRA